MNRDLRTKKTCTAVGVCWNPGAEQSFLPERSRPKLASTEASSASSAGVPPPWMEPGAGGSASSSSTLQRSRHG